MSGTSDVTGTRLVRNTLANGLARVVGAGLTIVMTPFLLHRLGPSEFGIWLLATTLTFGSGYLAVADLGLQDAAIRFIAEARARHDVHAVNEVVSTTMMFFLVVGVVAGAVLASLAGVLSEVFNISSNLHGTAAQVFLIVGLQIIVDLPVAALLALIEGTQNYGWLRTIDVGGRVLWAGLVIIAVLNGRGVVALAVLALAVAVLAGAAAIVVARRVQPGLRISPRLATRATLRRTAGYGSSLMAMRVLSVIYSQMDRAIIGIAISAAAVASYEVAFRIHSTAALVLAVVASSVMPAAAYVGVSGDVDRLRTIYLRGTKYAVGLATPVTVTAILYAKAIVIVWVGPAYVDMTGPARLFLIYPLLVSVHTIGLTMLVGLGRIRPILLLNVLAIGLNLVVSIALVDQYGISGVIWGTLVGYIVIWVPYTWLFLNHFDVSLPTWFRRIILPNVPALAVQVVVGLLTVSYVEDLTQFWQVAVAGALLCAVSFAVFGAVGVHSDERRELLQMVGLRRPDATDA